MFLLYITTVTAQCVTNVLQMFYFYLVVIDETLGLLKSFLFF